VNYFEQFGLAPSVDVDVAAIEAKYRALSLTFHPDRVAPEHRLEAVQKTASLNEAVKVLRDRVRRAFYLLKLQGVDLDRDDGPARKTLPPDFLEHILELREQLESARHNRDAARIKRLSDEVSVLSEATLKAAEEALRHNQVSQATEALARVKYFHRFTEEIEAIDEA
jgi:molecular chaperone HscB